MNVDKRKRSVYDPKSYRISKVYKILFDSCLTVLGKEKINLTYALLQHQHNIDVEIIKNLPTYNKNELAELMFDQVKKDGRSIQTLSSLLTHERIENITRIVQGTPIVHETPRGVVMFRILPEYAEFLKKFKKNKSYAEALELVIAYHVVHEDPQAYDMIHTTYSYLAGEELKKHQD